MPPDSKTLYAALIARDPSYDGHFFACVTTTGIFCRLSCPARKPKFCHTEFKDSIAACLASGYRACQRCRPLAPLRTREPMVADLMKKLEDEPARLWSEEDLTHLGFDPSTVRRAFKRHFGMTFLDLSRLRRAGRGLSALSQGVSVIHAQLDAGYESGSGFRDAIHRLLGDCPAEFRGRNILKADWIETPIGAMLAVADSHALHLLEFFDRKALFSELTRLRKVTRSSIDFGRVPPIDGIERELDNYFRGVQASFDTPLVCHGSTFTRSVWEALKAVPPGLCRSYSDVAYALGRPTAVRAVARANGANQIAIVIPCHRIVGADGALTGYGGGLWRKSWLIEHEKRAFFSE